MDQIAIMNRAATVSDEEASAITDALTRQLAEDYEPAWGMTAQLIFVPRSAAPPRGAWGLGIFDNATQANALGYHDITAEGLPFGKVFADRSRAVGVPVSTVASHELLEMRGDPDVNRMIEDAHRLRRFWAEENADPVQALAYMKGNVALSNFVFPAYFQTFRKDGPYDHMGALHGPLPALAPGGYMLYVENGRWGQITSFRATDGIGLMREQWATRAHEGGRRHKRLIGRDQWVRSTTP